MCIIIHTKSADVLKICHMGSSRESGPISLTIGKFWKYLYLHTKKSRYSLVGTYGASELVLYSRYVGIVGNILIIGLNSFLFR